HPTAQRHFDGKTELMTIVVRERQFNIRPIAQDDLDAVLVVYRQCQDFLALGPILAASMEMVRQDIEYSSRNGGVFCGIYTANEDMMGVVDYVPCNFDGDPHVAYFSLLMVAAPFRKQGIGTAVVEAIENEIGNGRQVTAILSGVQVNNPRAVQFWQRRGYRVITGPELQDDQTIVFGLRKDVAGSEDER
ncbi:MAG: N-acetyltransferase, partial [Candidatus Hydrogenedentes bacterium]|nr:N-acetyltransferase [Candidatus Hydrogenedentota bacterium]